MKTLKKEWITSQMAADILSERSGHTVSTDYVRRLANTGKITSEAIDGRTKLFLRADVEKYTVKQRSSIIMQKKKGDVTRDKDAELDSWWHKPAE